MFDPSKYLSDNRGSYWLLSDAFYAGSREHKDFNTGFLFIQYRIAFLFYRVLVDSNQIMDNFLLLPIQTYNENSEFNLLMKALCGKPIVITDKNIKIDYAQFSGDLVDDIRNNEYIFKMQFYKSENKRSNNRWKIGCISRSSTVIITRQPNFLWPDAALRMFPALKARNAEISKIQAYEPDYAVKEMV